MTKQEEISTGMYAVINNHTRGLLTPSQRKKLRDALLEYEDSKGVVVKVERELPKDPKDDPEEDALDAGYALGWRAMGRAITKAGYEAVEPLIK